MTLALTPAIGWVGLLRLPRTYAGGAEKIGGGAANTAEEDSFLGGAAFEFLG